MGSPVQAESLERETAEPQGEGGVDAMGRRLSPAEVKAARLRVTGGLAADRAGRPAVRASQAALDDSVDRLLDPPAH